MDSHFLEELNNSFNVEKPNILDSIIQIQDKLPLTMTSVYFEPRGYSPQQDIVIEVPSLDNFLDGIINGYSNKTVPNDHIYEFLFNNSGPDFFGKLISDVMGGIRVSYYIESFRETITNHTISKIITQSRTAR